MSMKYKCKGYFFIFAVLKLALNLWFFFIIFLANDHLIELHLIEIVIFHLIKISLITWSNYFTLFTWSKVKIMNSVKRLKIDHLIELFDQVPNKNLRILAVDRIFFKPKIPLLELSIKCQKRTYGFWQLIELFDQLINF